jgi:hypothetical protein
MIPHRRADPGPQVLALIARLRGRKCEWHVIRDALRLAGVNV